MSIDRNPGLGRRLFLRMTTALVAAIGLPALFAGRQAAAEDAAVGEVAKLRGQARVSRQNKNVMLDVGTKVMSGDAVVTGPDARLKIQFLDGSTITLAESVCGAIRRNLAPRVVGQDPRV